MQKLITAKVTSIPRVRATGLGILGRPDANGVRYDDDKLHIKLQIDSGPATFVDRKLSATVPIYEFINNLSLDTALALRNELLRRLPLDAKEEEK